jgi:predicted helicase
MRNFIGAANLGLMAPRQAVQGDASYSHTIAIENIVDNRFVFSNKGISQAFPLYLLPEQSGQLDALCPRQRRPNLDPKLYATICEAAGIDPADQAGPDDDFRSATGEARPSEVKVFDYIYGVLHSPAYRETFAEFLKIDFPRIPYPPSPEVFRHVSEKGEQLRRLHLMEPAAIGDVPYPYMGEGDDVVASGFPKWEPNPPSPSGEGHRTGRVQINKEQYFAGVPEIAWGFHIGGYQPAQKWLKDRRGRSLSFDDITHYQRIVKILAETDRIMREIELPLDESAA